MRTSCKFLVLSSWFGERKGRARMTLTAEGTRCVGRVGRNGLGTHTLYQSCEHAPHLAQCHVQPVMLLLGEKTEVACKQKKIFQFTRRPRSNVQKLSKLRPCGTSATFRDIGGHRERCAPHLASKTKSFVFRKCERCTIHAQDQRMTLLPDLQLLEILHSSNHLFLWVYLQLITNNCQLVRGTPC
jgi:hypothetical protein